MLEEIMVRKWASSTIPRSTLLGTIHKLRHPLGGWVGPQKGLFDGA
jgi:hypothetical protein